MYRVDELWSKLLKRGYIGDSIREYHRGSFAGYTRSLDYSSHRSFFALGVEAPLSGNSNHAVASGLMQSFIQKTE